MAEAVKLLVGGPQPLYVLAIGALCIAMQVFFSYERTVRVLKWLTLALFAYVAVVLAVGVPWQRALVESARPWAFLPTGTTAKEYAAMVVAVLGTTISPYLFFWQATQEVEDCRRRPEGSEPAPPPRLRRASTCGASRATRSSAWASRTWSRSCIVVATAVTLNQRGIVNIQTSAQAAEALRPVAGEFAFLVFALGIIGTGLLAVPVLAGSAAYAVSELFGWKAGLVTRLPRGARLLPDHHRRHRHRLGDGRLRRRPDQGAGPERDRQRRDLGADHGRADDDRPIEEG